MNLDELFSPEDLEAIRAATARAEGQTGGEVVAYAVARCDSYSGARWRGAALGAALAAVTAAAAYRALDSWGVPGVAELWILLPTLAGLGLGWALAAIPALERRLVPTEILNLRVQRRAAQAFLEEEVFNTRERTGVLLVLALFEHRVVVLGDEGIDAKVGPGQWQSITDGIADGIRQGRPAAALVEAIGACGELLRERGVELRDDDEDELPDGLRLRHE